MPRKADAYLIEDQDNPGRYLVRPSCAVIPHGKAMTFRIRNMTDHDDFWVKMPAKYWTEGDEPRQIPAAHGKALDLNLQDQEMSFRYEVFVDGKFSDKAKGESDPVIIIDPPL